jgi:hypothetical protein
MAYEVEYSPLWLGHPGSAGTVHIATPVNDWKLRQLVKPPRIRKNMQAATKRPIQMGKIADYEWPSGHLSDIISD